MCDTDNSTQSLRPFITGQTLGLKIIESYQATLIEQEMYAHALNSRNEKKRKEESTDYRTIVVVHCCVVQKPSASRGPSPGARPWSAERCLILKLDDVNEQLSAAASLARTCLLFWACRRVHDLCLLLQEASARARRSFRTEFRSLQAVYTELLAKSRPPPVAVPIGFSKPLFIVTKASSLCACGDEAEGDMYASSAARGLPRMSSSSVEQ